MTSSPRPSRRTLRALDFMTVWPKLTWPSPAITTFPPLRTERMVVPCQDTDCEEDCSSDMQARWRSRGDGSSSEGTFADAWQGFAAARAVSNVGQPLAAFGIEEVQQAILRLQRQA